MECTGCKQIKTVTKDTKNPCFPCDSCRSLYCGECSELSPSEIKCMPLQKRLLKFHCFKCRRYELVDLLENTIADKDELIKAKDEIIELLRGKLDQLGTEHEPSKPSYAAALLHKRQQREAGGYNCPEIVIKPRESQDASKTLDDINQSVNPATLKVGIARMKASKSGVVVVKCASKQESATMIDAMRSGLDDSYNIAMSKMRRPRIKIPGFKQEMTGDEIEESIKCQNKLVGDIKVVYIRRKKSEMNTIICECSPEVFSTLVAMRRVCIGWERYPVYEDLEVPRCFRCQGFYHKKSVCRNDLVCIRCSGRHEAGDCPSQTKCCRNCVVANRKYGKEYDTNHETTDTGCPVYKYHLQVLKNRTEYVSNHSGC